jgi:methionyl-tRNA formyltransferase
MTKTGSLVILVPSDLMYANLIAKELIRAFPDKISLIIESDTMIHGHGFLGSLKAYLKTCGFKYLSSEATKEYLYKFRQLLLACSPDKNKEARIFYSFRSLAKKHKIPIIKSKGINPAVLEKIKRSNPDLIICVYFQHILGKKTLSLPRLGTLNIHPSLLPRYRGINPVFWALADGQTELGATVHFINKDIDCGDILAQKKVPIAPHDTEHSLFLKCSIAGAEILIKAIRDVQNKSHSPIRQQQESNYYSLPTAEAVCRFLKHGRRFFRVREFLGVIK